MQEEFWHNRWETNHIGFNQNKPNELLVQHFDGLNLKKGDTVFVPLCGKSVDMLWLLQEGFDVVGAELSPIACESFFRENNLPFTTRRIESFTVFEHKHITLFSGDFFQIKPSMLSKIEAIYDRAALYALPPDLRKKYAEHMIKLFNNNVKMLLLSMVYNQNEMSGPPFSVDEQEINELYSESFHIQKIYDQAVKSIAAHLKTKGLTAARETAYVLTGEKIIHLNRSELY